MGILKKAKQLGKIGLKASPVGMVGSGIKGLAESVDEAQPDTKNTVYARLAVYRMKQPKEFQKFISANIKKPSVDRLASKGDYSGTVKLLKSMYANSGKKRMKKFVEDAK